MLYSFLIKFGNVLIKALGVVLTGLLAILPNSPFEKYIIQNSYIRQFVGYINYFVPVAEMLIVLESWCVAIAVYYGVQIVLRWLKAIE